MAKNRENTNITIVAIQINGKTSDVLNIKKDLKKKFIILF